MKPSASQLASGDLGLSLSCDYVTQILLSPSQWLRGKRQVLSPVPRREPETPREAGFAHKLQGSEGSGQGWQPELEVGLLPQHGLQARIGTCGLEFQPTVSETRTPRTPHCYHPHVTDAEPEAQRVRATRPRSQNRALVHPDLACRRSFDPHTTPCLK